MKVYVALILGTVLLVGPFAWMLTLSVTTPEGDLTVANYTGAWREAPIGRYAVNSLFISGATVGLYLFLCSLFAYPLAKLRFAGASLLRLLLLATFLVPWEVTFVPLFEVCARFGLYDSAWGVILPASVNAFGILFMTDAFRTVPNSLIEAARLDGWGEFRIWWKVAVPLVRPSLAALAVLIFLSSWGSFLWPLVVLRQDSSYTLPVALSYLQGTFSANLRYLAAAAVLSALPPLALFLAMQRQFVAGLLKGSVKG